MLDQPSLLMRKERMYSSCWNIGNGLLDTAASTRRPFSTVQPLLINMVAPTPIIGAGLFTTCHIMRYRAIGSMIQSTSVQTKYLLLQTLIPALEPSAFVPPCTLSTTTSLLKRSSTDFITRLIGLHCTRMAIS